MAPTHALIGASWWLAGSAAAGHPHLLPVAAGTGISAALALAPDIDLKGSEASRALPPVTSVVSWAIRKSCGGHRRVTHSALGAVIFSAAVLVLVGVTGWPPWLALAAICGWVAHVAADLATEEGCPVLWPDLTKWHLLPPGLRVRTGLRPVKVQGSNRRRHTAEWWLVRPAAVLACGGAVVLLVRLAASRR